MKSNFKFTGANIAAALLVITYFCPWTSGLLSFSGYNLTSMGISPGLLTYALNGISRLVFVLLILVPISGGIVVYQNATGNMRFSKYYKTAHVVPALLLIVSMAGAYFKMRSLVSDSMEEVNNLYGDAGLRNMSQYMPHIDTPGLFDVLSIGAYLALAAAIYLALVSMGKIKDKEYFANTPVSASSSQNPVNN